MDPLARRLRALYAEDERLSAQIATSAAYVERVRVRAQIVGLENGTLLWLEERAHLPDRERIPSVLADSLGIALSSANDRLNRLWRAGVVERTPIFPARAGRRCYSYRVPT
jgi:DNA-binding MarR family transcriptional regulator